VQYSHISTGCRIICLAAKRSIIKRRCRVCVWATERRK